VCFTFKIHTTRETTETNGLIQLLFLYISIKSSILFLLVRQSIMKDLLGVLEIILTYDDPEGPRF